jgi:uncharacterized protein YutE (UPF0331/DUF86 family)
MIEALLQSEKIDRAFFEELQDINKQRNLIFHGHVHSVDSANVERVKRSAERLERLE